MSDESSTLMTINTDRFHEDLTALSQFGATEEGGVNRPAFSQEHQAARRWFAERAEDAGLVVHIDPASNHSAALTFPGADRTLLIGSHLDSVPTGGRFDGALGVISALEVLRRMKETGQQLSVNLMAMDFTDEESHFVEFLGSRAFTGKLPLAELQAPHLNTMRVAVEKMGLELGGMANCGRDPKDFVGYLELHIEQGPRLVGSSTDIGIVESIVGIRSHRLIFGGRADHAGTTPMDLRRNAGLGAGAFTLALHELLTTEFTDCVGNVGNMVFTPGVTNVVPNKVVIDFEYRFPSEQRGDAFESLIKDKIHSIADQFDLGLEIAPTGRAKSVQMDPDFQRVARQTAEKLGLSTLSMPSGAGHDAQIMSAFTPSCLLFVPSVGGISHNPAEFTTKEDCENGANMLLQIVLSNYGK
jgi:N-carbamoyl-L-amino-acid hydrolase